MEFSLIMVALPGRNLTQPSLDHRPYGAERYQQADFRGGTKKTSADSVDLSALSLDKRNLSLASEKDLKTCVNMDTKFQQVVQQHIIYYLLFFRCRRNGAEEAWRALTATWNLTNCTRCDWIFLNKHVLCDCIYSLTNFLQNWKKKTFTRRLLSQAPPLFEVSPQGG